MMGHNNPPRDRNFKKRWAAALFAHPKKPAGAVALAFRLYCAMDGEGRGAVISDKEFCDATGMSQRSTVNFKAWLIDEGFIHIHVRGYRGSASEFVAHIPQLDAPPAPNHAAGLQASDASISKGTHASDASSKPRLGEPGASIPQLDAPPAPNPKTSPAPARVVDINNIYNNTNHLEKNTPPPSEQVAARESGNGVVLKDGEEHVGHGVIVNCETVRHANFVINLKAIDVELCGAIPMDRIKAAAIGHALQWATEISSGKRPDQVVPTRPASLIRGSLQNQQRNDMIAEVKRDAAKSKGPKLTRWAQ